MDESHERAFNAALRLLSFRPRSERELRDRLRRKGFEPDVIDFVVERLRAVEALDDAEFAGFWVANRTAFRPRGTRLVAYELRQKGVAAEIAGAALTQVDEEEGAYRAAQKRLRTLPSESFPAFQQALAPYLQRRGFPYAVIRRVVQRCWTERHSPPEA